MKIVFLASFCPLNQYKWPREHLWIPISVRCVHLELVQSRANINRSHPPCFVGTYPPSRVHLIPSSLPDHIDLIFMSSECDSAMYCEYSDTVLEFWVSMINLASPATTLQDKVFVQRNHHVTSSPSPPQYESEIWLDDRVQLLKTIKFCWYLRVDKI